VPRPRFLNLDPLLRRRILETAGAEFSEHGFKHASLNHVIEALGLSKGVFYYYFDSKADLFAAVVDLVWDLLVPSRSFDVASLDAATYWPRIEALLRENHALLREHPWLAGITRLLFNPPRGAGIDKAMAEKLALGHAWMDALVRRGQEVGAVRRDVPMELLLAVLAAADQAGDRWMLDRWPDLTSDERERLSGQLFNLWRRIAAPAQGGDTEQRT
jgi:AcrR family transcriptional regulator